MECARTYEAFFSAGEVTEIRAYGLRGKNKIWEGFAGNIVYGYFDNAADFGAAADALDEAKAGAVYFIPNPVQPALLSRAKNRLKAAGAKSALTSDRDILAIRWILIDLDPVRPADISSSGEELDAAVALAKEITKFLRSKPEAVSTVESVAGYSGNGFHLAIRLKKDYPPAPDIVVVVKSFLNELHKAFSNSQVAVDITTYNPSRLWKVYGTSARKGDHTSERPWRRAAIHRKWSW